MAPRIAKPQEELATPQNNSLSATFAPLIAALERNGGTLRQRPAMRQPSPTAPEVYIRLGMVLSRSVSPQHSIPPPAESPSTNPDHDSPTSPGRSVSPNAESATAVKEQELDGDFPFPRHRVGYMNSSLCTAHLNRFNSIDLASYSALATPLFFYGSLVFPKQVSYVINETLTPKKVARLMTCAILHGYERLAVKGADFPAVVAATPTSYTTTYASAQSTSTPVPTSKVDGMLIVGLNKTQRQLIHAYESYLYDLTPVKVEITTEETMPLEAGGGPRVGVAVVDALVYVWNGHRSGLWEKNDKEWTHDGYLQTMLGRGLDEDDEAEEDEVSSGRMGREVGGRASIEDDEDVSYEPQEAVEEEDDSYEPKEADEEVEYEPPEDIVVDVEYEPTD